MLLDEPDAPAIERDLDSFDRLVASHLLQIELRRVGLRTDLLDGVSELLADVALIPLERAILDAAEIVLPPAVATLDAIHLATALHLAAADQLHALMTYDKQLAAGAREHGIEVLSPTDETD